MTKISVLYPNLDNKRFDSAYYLDVHMPLSIKRQGALLKSTQVDIGVTGVPENSKPPYIAMCHFLYDSLDEFLSSFLPHQKELTEDMINYTDIEPVIQISEVHVLS
jgi:uncharacterized protein (TIGR02118 family)